MKLLALFVSILTSLVAQSATAMCFEEAGQRYNVNPELLRAIAQVESSMNPAAMNMSHQKLTGSYDIGLMQINSRWLATLKRFSIDEAALKDACTSVMVGAWILADTMKRNGANWNGVGAYNAACTQLKGNACDQARFKYANLVWRAMNRFEKNKTASADVIAKAIHAKPETEVNARRSLIASVTIEDTEKTILQED